ncbi:MAG: fibronectin type III domain-containing protein [Phycisphaerales bacterium]|nr:fibronectin type III domain-containing protein [Phycisphaerales bacterium]
MMFLNRARVVALFISTAVATAVVAQPAADQKALVPTTIDRLQFDGQWPWLFLDRPIKDQGLDTLVNQRGRVRPYDLLATEKTSGMLPPAKDGITPSVRTIFRDLYTGAEVWRLTSNTNGTISHAANLPWNANGRLMRFTDSGAGTYLMDQESCAIQVPAQRVGNRWSPTDPYLTFFNGNQGGQQGAWSYDVKTQKPPRFLAPSAPKAGGLAGISEDGKWVCWLEGGQDKARRIGLARTDGSLYRSIRYDGGIVHEIKNPQPGVQVPPTTAGDSDVQGGMHAVTFARGPVVRMKTTLIGKLVTDKTKQTHFLDTDGKLVEQTPILSHGAFGPDGIRHIFEGPGGVRGRNQETGEDWLQFSARGKIEGHTSWTNDPDWAECSWHSPHGWEIVRLSMRPDASPIRLCSVCPEDARIGVYNSISFGRMSPDGTKVMFMSSMTKNMNEYLVVGGNPRTPQNLVGQWTAEGFKLTWNPNVLSNETKGYRIYRTDKSGQAYKQIGWVDTPEDLPSNSTDPLSFVVPGAKQGEKVFFAVRAQEWSGLLSRYSNDLASDASMQASIYIEPELGKFDGFKIGFDPVNASDLYYLFVPLVGTKCEVGFTNANKDAQVWVRVGSADGANVAFAVNGKAVPAKTYEGWTWVNVGQVSGEVKLTSESKGFKLDRIFIAADGSAPVGRGLDYPTAAAVVQVPADVKAKVLTPYAVEVTWATIPGVRYYNVYAADKPDFVPAQSNLLYSPPVGTERIVDWGLKPGTQYYYKVTAIDYDGSVSQPSATIAMTTPPITVQTVNVDYSAAKGGTVQADVTASNGKFLDLKEEETLTLKFNVPVDGDYVIWHQWRSSVSEWVPLQIDLNGKKETLKELYHVGGLYGKVLSKEWLWSRYGPSSAKKGGEGLYRLKAGEQTLTITRPKPLGRSAEFQLNKLIITNDQSFVPEGRVCIF